MHWSEVYSACTLHALCTHYFTLCIWFHVLTCQDFMIMLIKIKIVLSLYAIECTVLQWWTFERQQQYKSYSYCITNSRTATTLKQSSINIPLYQDGPVLRRAMGPPPDAPAGLGGLPPPQRGHRAPALLQVSYL